MNGSAFCLVGTRAGETKTSNFLRSPVSYDVRSFAIIQIVSPAGPWQRLTFYFSLSEPCRRTIERPLSAELGKRVLIYRYVCPRSSSLYEADSEKSANLIQISGGATAESMHKGG